MLLGALALLTTSFTLSTWHGALPHSIVARAATPMAMAGFGAPSGSKPGKRKASGKAAKGKKSAVATENGGLSAKRQWEIFRELRDKSDQVLTTSVYARLPDDPKWLNVGGCIVESPGTRIEACLLYTSPSPRDS